MSKGYELADRFDRVTDRLVSLVRSMSDEQWSARGEGAGWTVAQEALHLGVWMEIEGRWFASLAAGTPTLPLSADAANHVNDNLIADNPAPSREQVLLEIAGNRTMVRHMLIGLSDDQLCREVPRRLGFLGGGDGTMRLDVLAERMLPAHMERHIQNIEETIAGVG